MEYLLMVGIAMAAIARGRFEFRRNFSTDGTTWYQAWTTYAYRYITHLAGMMSFLLIINTPEEQVIGKTMFSIGCMFLLKIVQITFESFIDSYDEWLYEVARVFSIVALMVIVVLLPVPELPLYTIIPATLLICLLAVTVTLLVLELLIKKHVQRPFSDTPWTIWNTIAVSISLAMDYGALFLPSFFIHFVEMTIYFIHIEHFLAHNKSQ